MPEAVHAPERLGVRGKDVGSIGEHREEAAWGDTVIWEGLDACPGGGEALDKGEYSLGQQESVAEVVGGHEHGGKPVP